VPTEPAGTNSAVDRWMSKWVMAGVMVFAVVLGALSPVTEHVAASAGAVFMACTCKGSPRGWTAAQPAGR
jgi:hypothetical protein